MEHLYISDFKGCFPAPLLLSRSLLSISFRAFLVFTILLMNQPLFKNPSNYFKESRDFFNANANDPLGGKSSPTRAHRRDAFQKFSSRHLPKTASPSSGSRTLAGFLPCDYHSGFCESCSK